MAKITYRIPGQALYADLPANNTIYVLKGTTVKFKLAGPEFGAPQQPQVPHRVAALAARFGGPPVPAAPLPAAGAAHAPVPMDVEVTFNTASVSTVDYKNTVVSCGDVQMTAHAVVYEVSVTVTPLDTFRGVNAVVDHLGVDERVDLGCKITPDTLTAEQVGGLRWKLSGAAGGKLSGTLMKTATAKAAPAADGKAHYIAPYQTTLGALPFPAGSLTPSAASLQKTVTLQLVVDSGASKDRKVEKAFTVHTPQAEMRDVAHQYQHVQGLPSAGFRGYIYLSPKNVSFRTLEWREAGGKAVCTGGYFLYDEGKPHHPTGTDPEGGKFKSEVRSVGSGNLVDGCWVKQVDNVWTGYNEHYPGTYPALDKHAGQATNNASTMSWAIYWQYRVAGGADTAWITFQKAEHHAVMDTTGKVTISKAGASKTFNLNDVTESFPPPP